MDYDHERVVSAIEAFESGEMVVVTDDNDRENEGDLILAAVHCTEKKMAFIIRHTSGIVCVPMPKREAQRFGLSPMVLDNDSPQNTKFTVTVDFKYGITTGISAHDRALAVRNLANSDANANDFVRPGHIFPLIADENGVLVRSGHTEAAVDLCKLSSLPPIGVIGELVNDDGSVKHGDEVIKFAQDNNLHILTVSDLIAYRWRKEMFIKQIETTSIETFLGSATVQSYQLPWELVQHVAVIFGDIGDGKEIPIYLHCEDILKDILGQPSDIKVVTQRMIEREKRGILIYLRQGFVCVNSRSPIYASEGGVGSSERHMQAIEREKEWRPIGLVAQILKHLGISSVIIYAPVGHYYTDLESFGISISRTDSL
ncbi:3,4-dihydroxy-2-butanone-4-phosphate synthase [Bartonella ancashensis]|uniref:3,4-dihydroxy-2-butanone 4-phosphate synthase n=1 Tax=Bartonella ancashensis TaxID=1318743 RepID=A0A0M4L914_9HYPH|nr:3,4-dihydroxy-2-butanone-4-phosphate synthase [Bartonella ancashensis]ALE04063.1 3,4-dihydroxy-2-butanone 4-phosphate synthase [Bartonella ancashensis]